MTAFFNTGLTQQQFIDQYWQQKPLLIRQAFKDFQSPISAQELAGLACEAEIESRLIEEFGDNGKWQLRNGPFNDDDFASLADSHWTLLVQDVDKHVSELKPILDSWRFLPDWRRDDLMISYAADQGSVGAHTDGYDVFLLQAMGQRQWQIGAEPVYQPDLLTDIDLRILSHFEPDQQWLLEPGDILYLPPHFAHHGVAQGECMTFSIGFRAPKQVELLDAFTNSLLEKEQANQHFQDSGLEVNHYPHHIPQAVGQNLKQLLHRAIDEADTTLLETFGKLVTETKSSLRELVEHYTDDALTPEEVISQFEQGLCLHKNPYIRHAWLNDDSNVTLFIAGEAYLFPLQLKPLVLILAESEQLHYQDWLQLVKSDEVSKLLYRLLAEGIWYWQDVES